METLRCPTCVAILPDPEARRCPLCHAKLRKRRGRPIVLGESNRLSGRSLPVDTDLRTRSEERYEPFEPFVSKSKRKSAPVEAVIAFAPSEPAPEPVAPEPVSVASEPVIVDAEPEIVLAAVEPDAPEVTESHDEPEVVEAVVAEPDPEPLPEPVVVLDPEPLPEPVPAPVLADAEAPLPEVPMPDLLLLDDDLPELAVPEPAPVVAAHFLDPKLREATPLPEPIDLTEPEAAPAVIDLNGYSARSRNGTIADNHHDEDLDEDDVTVPERPVRPTSKWQAVPTRTSATPFDGTLNDMVEELHRKAREDVGSSNQR